MNRHQALQAFAHAATLSSILLTADVVSGLHLPYLDNTYAAQKQGTTPPSSSNGMLVIPSETLDRFRPLVASSPRGPHIVELEGDPQTGSSVTLFRYTNGYTGSRRFHTHGATYRSVLIEGKMKHWGSAGSEQTAATLLPGSYWRQPGGELHADHCLTDHCLALVVFDGKIDAHFADGHD